MANERKNSGNKIGFLGVFLGVLGFFVMKYLSDSFGFFLVCIGFISSLIAVVKIWIGLLK